VLFADYVRMIRARKDVAWDELLEPYDIAYLSQFIDRDAWYPMASFERMGNAILKVIANGDVEAARMWGALSVDQLLEKTPGELVVAGDPVDTLMRFRVMRSTFFDFDALTVREIQPGNARIQIAYGMGDEAEEAASYQTLGFFERVLALAGAERVHGGFSQRSWSGDAHTLLVLGWD
jgi:hypothetical protein